MAGYETKALLLSVLRYSQSSKDRLMTEKFIEELLIADGYVPEGENSKTKKPRKDKK